MFVYKINANGQATDLRFVPHQYIAAEGEIIESGDILPDINVLHETAYAAERQQKRIIDLVQNHMDTKAQLYGYDHILSASSYATSTYEKFKTEGMAFKQWRDDVWGFLLTILANVNAGTNTIATEAELISSLPSFPLDT